jgi:hypothetical protein
MLSWRGDQYQHILSKRSGWSGTSMVLVSGRTGLSRPAPPQPVRALVAGAWKLIVKCMWQTFPACTKCGRSRPHRPWIPLPRSSTSNTQTSEPRKAGILGRRVLTRRVRAEEVMQDSYHVSEDLSCAPSGPIVHRWSPTTLCK